MEKLSIRDQFAIAALASIADNDEVFEDIARDAYAIADAMMGERRDDPSMIEILSRQLAAAVRQIELFVARYPGEDHRIPRDIITSGRAAIVKAGGNG